MVAQRGKRHVSADEGMRFVLLVARWRAQPLTVLPRNSAHVCVCMLCCAGVYRANGMFSDERGFIRRTPVCAAARRPSRQHRSARVRVRLYVFVVFCIGAATAA